MKVASVNIGQAELIAIGDRMSTTGIMKRPVAGPVRIAESGPEGDEILDSRHHGGADQAVYAYATEDYEWWEAEAGLDVIPGLFGENLTISGLPADMIIGDRLLIGDVVLEATSARIPCDTLAARIGDRNFGMAFRKAERPGVYFRVLNPGVVTAGDSVDLIDGAEGGVTVLDLFRFAFATSHDADQLRRFLEAPIAERIRAKGEAVLESRSAE